MRILIACVVATSALVSAASPNSAHGEAPTIPNVESRIASDPFWYGGHSVQLELDEVLPGLVQMFDSSGQLRPAKGLTVSFYHEGRFFKSARTNEEGLFQAKLPVGIYSVVAGDLGDEKGFCATSVRVVPYVESPNSKSRAAGPKAAASLKETAAQQPGPDATKRLPPKMLRIAMIPASDVAFLRAQIARQIQRAQPKTAQATGRGMSTAKRSVPARRDFSSLLGSTPEGRALISPVAAGRILNEAIRKQLNEIPFDGPSHFNHRMFISEDQTIHGTLSKLDRDGTTKPVIGADMFLVRNRVARGTAKGNDDGTFVVRNVSPGVYSVIVVTNESFGAYAIEYLPVEYLFESKPEFKSANVNGPLNVMRFAAAAQPNAAPSPGTNSTIMSPEDSAAFLGNNAANGLGIADSGTNPAPADGGNAIGGGDSNAAFTSALLGTALGLGIAELLNSKNL